ncbi:hypothetical protein [Pedobacter heparinus]|uniref:hypothetical protein n=1 Tax=Pedobacter heparinus TaxID=984 RepID=UPI00292CC87F|nr:hypothetical protein [Pedobacter heparinus]
MMKMKLIAFAQEPILDTESLMAGLGISRKEANDLLWDLFEKEYIDLIPVLNEEKIKPFLANE